MFFAGFKTCKDCNEFKVSAVCKALWEETFHIEYDFAINARQEVMI